MQRFSSLPSAVLGLCVLALATVTAAAQDDRVFLSPMGDLDVFFVPGGDLVLAVSRSGRIELLSRPGLEPRAELHGGAGQKVRSAALSGDGEWIEVFGKAGVTVWRLRSRQPVLSVAQPPPLASAFHPTLDRLVTYQKGVGVAQWDLASGRRLEVTISSSIASVRAFEISASGRFLLAEGRCRVEKSWFDLCIFDLEDGSAVAWADDVERSVGPVYSAEVEEFEAFLAILEATGFRRPVVQVGAEVPGVDVPPVCAPRDDGLLFCCSLTSAALTDPKGARAPSKAKGSGGARRMLQLLGVPEGIHQMIQLFPGRTLWEVRSGGETGRISSCDLSADGNWLVLGIEGDRVELYSTSRLEERSEKRTGYTWRQPAVASRHEVP